jgi:hypothetical protein
MLSNSARAHGLRLATIAGTLPRAVLATRIAETIARIENERDEARAAADQHWAVLNASPIGDVVTERARQRALHPGNAAIDNPHTWVPILGEEFGEWCKGLLEGTNAREEAVHVAAVAVAFCEWYDAQGARDATR